MKILITGSSGLIGKKLKNYFSNHELLTLVRNTKQSGIYWNPSKGELNSSELEGLDVIIHLAGAGIADASWSPKRKAEILSSRVEGTKLLVRTINQLKDKPKVVIFASAIGIYKFGTKHDETSKDFGTGFLASICRAWEAEMNNLSLEVRKVILRIGVVLSKDGGALKKMLLPFKLCLGGRIASGQQSFSWIEIDDLIRLIDFCIHNPNISEVVNATAPKPVTNLEFTQVLAKVLKRFAIFPVPAFICRLLFGKEFAEELLLQGAEVYPKKAETTGFKFLHTNLESALNKLI